MRMRGRLGASGAPRATRTGAPLTIHLRTVPSRATRRRHPAAPAAAAWRPLRIVMIGQKGLPATFGGIEHHVEEVGRRLAERGHHVTVFCRSYYGAAAAEASLGQAL